MGGGGGGGSGWGGGGQGKCERRIEVFVKIKKNGWEEGGYGRGIRGWVGVRVDVYEELKFLRRFIKNGGGGRRVGGGEHLQNFIPLFVKGP